MVRVIGATGSTTSIPMAGFAVRDRAAHSHLARGPTSAIRSPTPPIPAEVIFPITDRRWLLWQGGQLRLWRTIGEAWRRSIGDPATRVVDAQLVLEGGCARAAARDGERRRRRAAALDRGGDRWRATRGAPHPAGRSPRDRGTSRARHRTVGRSTERVRSAIGRWLRDLAVPAGTIELAVDDAFQRIALATADGLDLVGPDALAATLAASDDGDAAAKPNGHAVAPVAIEPEAPVDVAPLQPEPVADEPFPDAPLVRLVPVSVTPDATASEVARVDRAGAPARRCACVRRDRGRVGRRPDRQGRSDEAAVRRRGRGSVCASSSGRAVGRARAPRPLGSSAMREIAEDARRKRAWPADAARRARA